MNVSTLGTPNPPPTFNLKKGRGAGPPSALGGAAAKDLQADLAAAEADYNGGRFDDAIAKYRAIMVKAPALTMSNRLAPLGFPHSPPADGTSEDASQRDPSSP